MPPPVFDGDLDAAVPGSDAARIPNSVTGLVTAGKIGFPVGVLQGFDVGARLALYAPGQPGKPIGHADVSGATAVTSSVEAIDWEQGAEQIADGTITALIEQPAINFRFVVAPPPPTDFASDAQKSVVAAALDAGFKEDAAKLGVSLGDAHNADADAMLRVKNGRLWIVRSDRPWVTLAGAFDETPSLAIGADGGKLGISLKDAVWSLARAAKLLRVTAALDQEGGTSSGNTGDLAMTATISKLPGQSPRSGCSGSEPPPGALSSPVVPLLPVAAGNCSFVDIEVKNSGDVDYYVSGFYVDSLGGISAIPANVTKRGCVRTLPSGGDKALSFRFWINTWNEQTKSPTSTGAENFVVLAIPKDAAHEPPKLCALTQPTLSAMQQTRDIEAPASRGGNSKLASLIGSVEGGTTRGVSAAAEDDGPAMTGKLFVFDVKP